MKKGIAVLGLLLAAVLMLSMVSAAPTANGLKGEALGEKTQGKAFYSGAMEGEVPEEVKAKVSEIREQPLTAASGLPAETDFSVRGWFVAWTPTTDSNAEYTVAWGVYGVRHFAGADNHGGSFNGMYFNGFFFGHYNREFFWGRYWPQSFRVHIHGETVRGFFTTLHPFETVASMQ